MVGILPIDSNESAKSRYIDLNRRNTIAPKRRPFETPRPSLPLLGPLEDRVKASKQAVMNRSVFLARL